jgi:ComEC/Rec2-related protein
MISKITSEFLLLFILVYSILLIVIKSQYDTYTQVFNVLTFIIWAKFLKIKCNHLRKKFIISFAVVLILNLIFFDIKSNKIILHEEHNSKQEFILDVTFDYFPTNKYEFSNLSGKINNAGSKNHLFKDKRIYVTGKIKYNKIKRLKPYTIAVSINESCINKDEIIVQSFRTINITKDPFQKLSFKNQKNLKQVVQTKSGGFGWAMLSGSKQFLHADLLKIAGITGTMHLFAVSGLHIGFFYLLLSLLTKPFSNFLITMVFIKLVCCFIYLFFINFPESGIRALLMISVYEVSKLLIGRQKGITVFCISCLLILILFPSVIYSLSCQLSFTVVLFILFILRDYDISNKILKEISLYPIITLAASTGTALLIFDYFNYFSYISLVSNLLIIPFISVYYTLNIFHFSFLLIFNCNFFQFFHEMFFLMIYKVIDYCSVLNTFFPIQKESHFDINNSFHLVLFLILLLSFMINFHWRIRFFSVSFYYICFVLFILFRSWV